jgi:hypothetical protein
MDRSVSPAFREAECGYQDKVHIPSDGVDLSRPNALIHKPQSPVTRRQSLDDVSRLGNNSLASNNVPVTHLMTQNLRCPGT